MDIHFIFLFLLTMNSVFASPNLCINSNRKAYVITTKTFLPQDTIASITSLGFTPQIFPAIQPFKELFPDKVALYNSCFNVSFNENNFVHYDNTKFNTLTTLEL